jgi:predicted O-linked N-acetylglucosamine transferase (SPINDLY family)
LIRKRESGTSRRIWHHVATSGSLIFARALNVPNVMGSPASRVATGGFAAASAVERVRQQFVAHGIAAERIELLGHEMDPMRHLATYARLDVALDTFPYNGTTTTCEAMWMGVPVVTLAGRTHAGRVGVSLLEIVRLRELIAQDHDGYIRLAVELAQDRKRLAELRAGLRARMRTSPLMNGYDFARRLESAYRTMWRAWCGIAS